MSHWTDLAKWRGPTPNQGGPMRDHKGLVLHIAEGFFEGTIAWQKNPVAQVSSHFVVSREGEIAQIVDSDVIAWAQHAGNTEWLSVENEGFPPEKLTAAQIEANAQLLARAHQEYQVPLVVTDDPAQRGLGHHSMGREHGLDWGHDRCPGPAIVAQKGAIVARAVEIGTPGSGSG
ncbi:MAG TPA: peptidoglycan recognition family protein [Micromonospora sp.]